MKLFLSVLTIVFFQCGVGFAEVKTLSLSPSDVNPKARLMRGPHLAYWDSTIKNNNLLLVSIGGTESLPSDFAAFDTLGASLGFQVLAIDYDNHVISTTCAKMTDDLCFDHFRAEVVSGEAVSSLLEVDRANSIEVRITDLLRHLKKSDPTRWGGFLVKDQVVWNKVVVAGHSQGSGHAAYLSKIRRLHGVLMFAGPQDRFENEKRTVPWVHRPSKTPASRYYSFLHEKDFFGSAGQIKIAKIFLKNEPIKDHILITNEEVKDPHMSVITPQFKKIWQRLLQAQL